MDRTSWIVVTLCVAGLIGWFYFNGDAYQPKPVPQTASPTPAQTTTPTPSPVAEAPTPAPVPETPAIEAHREKLSTNDANYIFRNDIGGIEQVELVAHHGENEQFVTLNPVGALPIGAIGHDPAKALGGFSLSADPAKGEAILQRSEPNGLRIVKRFVIPANTTKDRSYSLSMELDFQNTGTAAIIVPAYYVGTGGAAPIHANDLPIYTRFDWYHQGKMSNIDVNWFNASEIPLIGIQWSPLKSLYNETKPDAIWASAASQYFCTIVTAETAKGVGAWANRYDTHKLDNAPVYGIQGGLVMPGFTIEPGQSAKQTFQIYAGPKELTQLRKMKSGQDVVMNFGMFGFVSEFLLWAMNGLYGIFHNYAAAIIVLTLLIKSVLWPVQNKATNEMRKMAALSPKMTEMREKHKDDPQKLNEEMMKLYKEYGVNPFSGCLPMLIQIPIFFGFYAMLGSAIELRNSSFLWVRDLSQPDTVGHVLGFPINVLPIVMAGTMVWQMVISPKSGDAMQQRIFYFMPIIFLVFCYNYASGLALYWTTQNIFSISSTLPHAEQATPHAGKEKRDRKTRRGRCEEEKEETPGTMSTSPTAREMLDTMLGYLGFVFEIEEQERDGHLVLQIMTHEADRLIGRRGQTLDDLQFLLNRLLQAGDTAAPRVVVDVDHHRAMRDNALVTKIRHLADAVKSTSRPLQTEPLNSYDRYVVHNTFKDDPDIATWSPPDDAKLKRITVKLRKKNP